MAQEQYTPGPWETSGYAIMADGSLVAHVVRDMGVDVEGRANARLIAAAPDMLAALLALEAHCKVDNPATRGNPAAHAAEGEAIRKMVQAAIAKASPSTRRDGPVLREGVA